MATVHVEVEFTGLCLYVHEKDNQQQNPKITGVTVLMPDCRRSIAEDLHLDGEHVEPHAGYLRLNLANLADFAKPIAKGNSLDGPKFEVVYQFDREELKFIVDGASAFDHESIGLPGFRKILGAGPELLPGITNGARPEELLFRTKLRSGKLRGLRGNAHWEVTSPVGTDQSGQYSEVVTWAHEIDVQDPSAFRITLELASFDDNSTREIVLKPILEDVEGGEPKHVIQIKIANLCSTNPLEWDSLTTHVVNDNDPDFRALYRLFKDLPPGIQRALPVPQITGFQAFGVEDCLGGCFDE